MTIFREYQPDPKSLTWLRLIHVLQKNIPISLTNHKIFSRSGKHPHPPSNKNLHTCATVSQRDVLAYIFAFIFLALAVGGISLILFFFFPPTAANFFLWKRELFAVSAWLSLQLLRRMSAQPLNMDHSCILKEGIKSQISVDLPFPCKAAQFLLLEL